MLVCFLLTELWASYRCKGPQRSLVHSPIGEVTKGTCFYMDLITDDSVRVLQLNSPIRNKQLIIVLCRKKPIFEDLGIENP